MIQKITIRKKISEIHVCIKNNIKCDNIDLVSGISGYILFQYQFYAKFNRGDKSLINYLKQLYSLFPDSQIGLTYSTGFSGVFDVLNYLNEKQFIDNDYKDTEDLFNKILKQQLLYDIEKSNLDFLHGSSGILAYLISSNSPNNSKEFYSQIINLYLKKIVKHQDNLIAFPSYNFKTFSPNIDINLSLSHGNSAIICILSKIFLKTNNIKIKPIIEDLFKSYYVIKQNRNNRILSLYPYTNVDLGESRMAWCYGDLGIASAFWQAGKTFDNTDWKEEAITIMLHSAKRRNLEGNGVVDAGICHGTAGIAHIFNRFYKETGIKEFDVARWYWLKQTLEMAKFNDGLAGYKSWRGEYGWQNDYGFLEGISGIGLVLLGFLTDDIENLRWDRCLLLS